MSSKEFEVNGTDYKVALTDQVIGQVNNLKELYNAAYEDPESFEDVSAEISTTINEIAGNVEPPAEDSDLDGLIQEIIKAVDSKAAEIVSNRDSEFFSADSISLFSFDNILSSILSLKNDLKIYLIRRISFVLF